MILWTVVPEEFVLAGLDYGTGELIRGWPPGSDAAELVVQGGSGPVRLLVHQGSAGGWEVGRLISSDPFDYLDPAFAPGRRLGQGGVPGLPPSRRPQTRPALV